ncbi:Acetamidase/Formamidase [Leucobacter sp. 7(1)]|uniref:acetamidase/formamidase family protein n=1 Tax=Leucobacter sp. 7(1) TaxID=1255613 RepID=UPI00097EBE10|nr:acetamidase/formamidase family protein [Leucobacter sp. 7(1)]SJN11803.1 Acetamidase/Formamidase [Leucobacter sp. 7(1)]
MTTECAELFYELEPDLPMSRWVEDGASARLRMLDASGGQFVEGFDYEGVDRSQLFPVTGPIGLVGARAGDTIAIHVRELLADPLGHTWTRRGLGFAAPTDFRVRALSTADPVINWATGRAIPVVPRPHLGTLGVLPGESFEPRSLGIHGGNIDTVHLGAGATLWVIAQVDGGGVFAGDTHAAIGDAEICGTGIEAAAVCTLNLSVERDWEPLLPTLYADGKYRLIADGDSTDEALERGVRACTELFARASGMSVGDAYLAIGLLLEVELCQVVNPRRSVSVSLGSGADLVLGPRWREW